MMQWPTYFLLVHDERPSAGTRDLCIDQKAQVLHLLNQRLWHCKALPSLDYDKRKKVECRGKVEVSKARSNV